MSKKTKQTTRPTLSAAPAEEYRPSDNAAKYDIPDPQYRYKILASRNDYIALQEEVTRYLNDGWTLAGGLATSIHADAYASVTLFAQAVYKIS